MIKMRIGWGRETRRLAAGPQRAALTAAGCDRVWIEGDRLPSGRRIDRAWMLADVRGGDTIVVTDARLLIPDGDGHPSRRLRAALADLQARGAEVEVLATKLHTRTRAALGDLMAAALEAYARGRTGSPGRPRETVPDDDLAWMLPIWRDLTVPTDQAACDRINAGGKARHGRAWQVLSKRQVIGRLDASGRSVLRRKRKS